MSRKFLFHSRFGGVGLAKKLVDEGYEVILFTPEKNDGLRYEGICEKAETIEKWEKSAVKGTDIFIFDSVGLGEYSDELRSKGHLVWGGGKTQDLLEVDRIGAISFMQSCGVKVPPTWAFKNKKDATDFLQEFEGKYVFKACDDDLASSTTHIGENSAEMTSYINGLEYDGKFILQSFISGIELSTEVWFNGNSDPVSPSNHTIETKRCWSGDVGVNTGSQSSLQWAHKGLDSKAITEGLGKCFARLKEMKYVGCLDINAIINEGGLYFIENTARHGYGAVYALLQLFGMKYGDLIIGLLVDGMKEMQIARNKYGMTIRVSKYPYPLEPTKKTAKAVRQIFGSLTLGERIDIRDNGATYWLLDSYKDDDGKFYTAGIDGIILELGTSAPTIKAGEKFLYDILKRTPPVGDAQYRIDSFERAKKNIPVIKALGYETAT